MTHALQSFNVSSFSARSTSLQKAIEEGDLRAIQSLLKQGSPVNSPLPSKELPLHAVIRSARFSTNQDKIEAVKLFIQTGANFEAKDIHGLTALDHAIHLQNIPLAKAMISEKIGIASEIIKNQVEIKRTSDSLADVIERLQHKTAVDPTELGPLQKAAYVGNVEELKKAKTYKQSNASIQLCLNQLDKHGLAPIHYAILGNQEAAFETLLSLGADPKVLTRDSDTIIHLAAANKSPCLPKTLDSKVDVNYRNTRGETALHYAFLREHWNTIQTLMQKGADPLIADLQGISPPAAFVSMSMQKDPLLISAKNLVQTVFEVIFLWQLQSQDFETLSQFRSWPAALTASLFGVLAAKAMPLVKQKQISAIGSLAKECIPGVGLGWTAKRTYHSFSDSFQKVTRAWNYLGYRTLDALPSLVMESLTAITSVAIIGMQAAVHASVLKPRQETGLSGTGIQSGNSGTGSATDSVILQQPSAPARETLSLLADILLPTQEIKIGAKAQWFINTLRKPTLFDLPKPSSDLRDVVAPKALTYLQQKIEQEAMFPNVGSVVQWFIDTLHKTPPFDLPKPSIDLRSTIVPTFPQRLNIRMPNDQHPQEEIITPLLEDTSKTVPSPQMYTPPRSATIPTFPQQANNRTQNTLYHAQHSFVNVGSTIQPKIDLNKKDQSLTGKAEEEGRLRQVTASQYSQTRTVLGSEAATDASNSSYSLKTPQNISEVRWGHVDTNIKPSQQNSLKSIFAFYAVKLCSPFLLKFSLKTYNWLSNLFSGVGSTKPPVTDSSQDPLEPRGEGAPSLDDDDSPKAPFIVPIQIGSQLSFLGRSSSSDLSTFRRGTLSENLERHVFSQSSPISAHRKSLITATLSNEKIGSDSSSSSTEANDENIVNFDEISDRGQDIISSIYPDLRHSLELYLSHSPTVPQSFQHTTEDTYRVLINLVSPTLLLLQPQDDLQGEAATTYPVSVSSNLDNLNDLEAAPQPDPSVNANQQQDLPSSLGNPVNAFDSSPALSTIEGEGLEEENDLVTIEASLNEAASNENIAPKKKPSDSEENTISRRSRTRDRSLSFSSQSSEVPAVSRSASSNSVYHFTEVPWLAGLFNAHPQPNQSQSLSTLVNASDTRAAPPNTPEESLVRREIEEGSSDPNTPLNPLHDVNVASPTLPSQAASQVRLAATETTPPVPDVFSLDSHVHDLGATLPPDGQVNAGSQRALSPSLKRPINASGSLPALSTIQNERLEEENYQVTIATLFDEAENSEPNEEGRIASPSGNDNITQKKSSDSEENTISSSPVPQNQNAISRPRTLGRSLSSSSQSPPVPSVSRSASSNSVYDFTGMPLLTGLFNAHPQPTQPQSLATIINAPATQAALPTTPDTSLVERENDQVTDEAPLKEEENSDPNILDNHLYDVNVSSPTPLSQSSQADSQEQEAAMEPPAPVVYSVDNALHAQEAEPPPDSQVNAGSQRALSPSLERPINESDSPARISTIENKSSVKKRLKSRSKSSIFPSPSKIKSETPNTTTTYLGKNENADPNPQQKTTQTQRLVRRKLNTANLPNTQPNKKSSVEEQRTKPLEEKESKSKRPKVPSTDLEMDPFNW